MFLWETTHINGFFFVVVRGQKSLFIVLQYIIYITCSNTGMDQNQVTQTLGSLYIYIIHIYIYNFDSFLYVRVSSRYFGIQSIPNVRWDAGQSATEPHTSVAAAHSSFNAQWSHVLSTWVEKNTQGPNMCLLSIRTQVHPDLAYIFNMGRSTYQFKSQ